jgi:cobaltochelatase CobN
LPFWGACHLAVKSQAGKYPDADGGEPSGWKRRESGNLAKSIGKALRTRYLNPKWIEGMKKDGYAGARAMDKFVEHLWGFQVTTPFAVDKTQWEQIHEVYIEDKYGLDIKKFFDKNNPWAQQSIAARMLEADRKNYWKAPEEIKKNWPRPTP